MEDSLLVPKKYVVAATKAYTELKSYKSAYVNCESSLHYKDIEVDFYKKSARYWAVVDSTNQEKIQNLTEQRDKFNILYEDYKHGYKSEKRKKILAAVSTPVVAVLGALGGFLLGKYID